MMFPTDVLMHAAAALLGVAGYMVARYIYHHKQTGKVLVCPIKMDCHSVVHSDYSRLFGIPVEFLGMFYYFVITVWNLSFLISPSMPAAMPFDMGMILSSIAFVFSIYLIGVQIFALKKGCFWCFVSAFISTLIFVISFYL